MSGKPVIIVLHGPSGVGKDTVIDLLRQRTGIHRATSTASRPPRDDERDGKHYHFVDEAEFERRIARGCFAEHARVYNEWKGLEKGEIEGPVREGRDVIIRTDVQGARTWRQKLEGATTICLIAENSETQVERLKKRRTETNDKIAVRLKELEEELADLPNNDYVVVNREGRLEDTVAELITIIEAERANPHRPVPRLLD
jgi:guanylate kinase